LNNCSAPNEAAGRYEIPDFWRIRMSQTAPISERVVVWRFSSYGDAKLAFDRPRVARIPDRRMSVTGSGLC
jgi:hypothetical protein